MGRTSLFFQASSSSVPVSLLTLMSFSSHPSIFSFSPHSPQLVQHKEICRTFFSAYSSVQRESARSQSFVANRHQGVPISIPPPPSQSQATPSLKKVLNGQGRNPRFSIPLDTSKTIMFTLTMTVAVALNEHHHDPEHNHLQSLWPPRLLNCNLSYGFACKQLEMMDPGYVYTLSNLFKNLCFS